MRNWKVLSDEIKLFQQAVSVYLDSHPPLFLKASQEHHNFVFEYLICCIDNTAIADDEKEKTLRGFLRMRWNAIRLSSVDYTFHPDFPANRACWSVAKFLVKEDECIAQVLMPTIKKIIGIELTGEDRVAMQYALSDYVSNDQFLLTTTSLLRPRKR